MEPTPDPVVDSVAVPGMTEAGLIDTGRGFTCGVSGSGNALCWGDPITPWLEGASDRNWEPALLPRPVRLGGNFRKLGAGERFACALDGDGRAFCWGDNFRGQLGSGASGGTPEATPVTGDLRFVDLAVGEEHACAVTESGEAWCWGDDFSGQLGDGRFGSPGGNTVFETAPLRVEWPGPAFQRITAGDAHTCALTEEGGAVCWGRIDFLGQGRWSSGLPSADNILGPTPVPGHTFVALAAGPSDTCGLDAAGAAVCWGGLQYEPAPNTVSGIPALAAISVGEDHSCGIDREDRLHCWGRNTFGQMGNGSVDFRPPPAPVTELSEVVAVTAGRVHTCAVERDGTAWCWGSRGMGNIGDGIATARAEPVPVAEGLAYVDLAGQCGLTAEGAVYCWRGDEDGHALLPDEVRPREVPAAQPLATLAGRYPVLCGRTEADDVLCSFGRSAMETMALPGPVAALAVGGGHACALDEAGRAYCWGFNDDGQLGIGNASMPVQTPAAVAGDRVFTDIVAGVSHTCGLTVDGAAWCWGDNVFSELGTTTGELCAVDYEDYQDTPESCSTVPVPVDGRVIFERLTANHYTTCGFTANGTVHCWGRLHSGSEACEAPPYTNESCAPGPERLFPGLEIAQVTPGPDFLCALDTAGIAYCAGTNYEGRLGNGTFRQPSNAPLPVLGGHTFTALHAFESTVCGLTQDGRAWCWGSGRRGETGDAVGNIQPTPSRVEGATFSTPGG